jgi:hypothetical protein
MTKINWKNKRPQADTMAKLNAQSKNYNPQTNG